MDKVLTIARLLLPKTCAFLVFLGISLPGVGQVHVKNISAADSLLFRKYLHIDMPLRTDVVLLQNFHYYLQQEQRSSSHNPWSTNTWVPDSELPPYWEDAKEQPLESIRKELKEQFNSLHDDAEKVAADKRQLVECLTAFGRQAQEKPLFYQEIASQFGGDIAAYVDHLYAHSIMGNEKVFKKFMRNPKSKAIQSDPGFQFTLGLLLYEKQLQGMR